MVRCGQILTVGYLFPFPCFLNVVFWTGHSKSSLSYMALPMMPNCGMYKVQLRASAPPSHDLEGNDGCAPNGRGRGPTPDSSEDYGTVANHHAHETSEHGGHRQTRHREEAHFQEPPLPFGISVHRVSPAGQGRPFDHGRPEVDVIRFTSPRGAAPPASSGPPAWASLPEALPRDGMASRRPSGR